MARTAWSFVDPETTDQYFWPVNPNTDGGSNSRVRNTGFSVEAGMRRTSLNEDTIDNIVMFVNIEQKTFNYSGFVYTQDQLDDMVAWCEKEYPIEMYDDLGRGFLVYITTFSLSRVRSRQNPYKHSYNFNGIILEDL